MSADVLAQVSIATRFRGPPTSGNGGYVAGLLAGFASDVVEVRLRVPPPLETALDVVALDGERLELRAGDQLVATAEPAELQLDVPPAPSLAAAQDALTRYAGFQSHTIPGCFVCGTERGPGDGLCIYAGPVQPVTAELPANLVASPWTPDASLAGTRGRVRPEFHWAALDCPGAFAVSVPGQLMLLGSMRARLEREVEVGEPCVVVGWSLGAEGRKHRAATALYGADGACVARAQAIWIELR